MLNDIIFATRMMYFQESNQVILDKITSSPESKHYWPCSLNGTYVNTNSNVSLAQCDFMYKFHPIKILEKEVGELKHSQEWVSKNYFSVRTVGDELDAVFNGDLEYVEFDGDAESPGTKHKVPVWTAFLAKVIDAVEKLHENTKGGKKIGTDPALRLDFQFIQINRNTILDRLVEIQDAGLAKMRSIMNTEVLIHLIISVIFTAGIVAVFLFVFVPGIHGIQSDRILILKLMLLVPKSVVWDYVYTIYCDGHEDNEEAADDGEDGISGTGQSAKDAAKARALKMRSEDPIDIVNDSAYTLLYFFGFGLASLCLPLIVHVAWRYSFNAAWSQKLYYYQDIVLLYAYANSLLWRSTGVLAPTEFLPNKDAVIFHNLSSTANELRHTADEAFDKYYQLQKNFVGVVEMDKLLYDVEQNTHIHPTCKDAMIEVKVHKSGGYKYPAPTDGKDSIMVPAKDTRCNDELHVTFDTPPDLRLPNDFSVRATHGVGTYVQTAIQSAWIMGQTPGYNKTTGIPQGPVDGISYWFLYEGVPHEGVAALGAVKVSLEEQLVNDYRSSQLAFNATYAASLVYTLIVFLWFFASCKKDLLLEARHNRDILFMIPLAVMVKSQPILDFIERSFQELSL